MFFYICTLHCIYWFLHKLLIYPTNRFDRCGKEESNFFSNSTNILYCTINLLAKKQSDHQNNLKKLSNSYFCFLSASTKIVKRKKRREKKVVSDSIWILNKFKYLISSLFLGKEIDKNLFSCHLFVQWFNMYTTLSMYIKHLIKRMVEWTPQPLQGKSNNCLQCLFHHHNTFNRKQNLFFLSNNSCSFKFYFQKN